MKFILTGGGTGGHVYPAIAIAEELKKHLGDSNTEFLYLGVRGRAEEKILPGLGYAIRFVSSAGLAGKGFKPLIVVSALKTVFGIFQALFILLRFRPDGVIGTGGYASVPAVLAAIILRRLGLLRTRIFIHEQNFAPGGWNRMISRWVDRFWISFEGSARFLPRARVELTGYPVRWQIASLDKAQAREKLGIAQDARIVLAFGGSLGARTINRAIADALPSLLADPTIVVFHGTGALKSKSYDAVKDTAERVKALALSREKLLRYHPLEYINEIHNYYAAADLVVSRAGAGTLNELCRCGLPALVIPKSNLAGEHQVVNALALSRVGACEVIFERPVIVRGNPEAEVKGEFLARRILDLLSDQERLEKLSRAALALINDHRRDIFAESVKAEIQGGRLSRQVKVKEQAAREDDPDPVRLSRLSPAGILAYADKIAAGKEPGQIDSNPNVELLRFFADGYLVSPRWQIRNIGIKLIGLTNNHYRRKLLLALAGDRSPAPLRKRIIWKDFRQVGFIRRNALAALTRLGIWDEELRQVLVSALEEDPYYEVRAQAACSIIRLRDKIGSCENLAGALKANLNHRSLEVRWCCLEALGAVAPDSGYLGNVDVYLLHRNWRIRQALLNALRHLFERGIITPADPVLERLGNLIPTCTDFIPTFPLKRALNRLHDIRQREVGEEPSQ